MSAQVCIALTSAASVAVYQDGRSTLLTSSNGNLHFTVPDGYAVAIVPLRVAINPVGNGQPLTVPNPIGNGQPLTVPNLGLPPPAETPPPVTT